MPGEDAKGWDLSKWKPYIIGCGVALILSVTSELIGLFDRFTTGPKIEASCESSYVYWPEGMWSEVVKLEGLSAKQRDESAALPSEKFSNISGRVKIDLSNSGNRGAENLRVKVDSDGIAFVKRDTGAENTIIFQNVVELGDLGVGDSVELVIWTDCPLNRY